MHVGEAATPGILLQQRGGVPEQVRFLYEVGEVHRQGAAAHSCAVLSPLARQQLRQIRLQQAYSAKQQEGWRNQAPS